MSERFTMVKKGYDPAEVNKYIEGLELVITSYKEKDAAIKNAIISAQMTASEIINEANAAADKIKESAVDKLDAIADSVTEQKRLIKEFYDEYERMVAKYLHSINDTDVLDLYTRINELESYISSLSGE